MDEIPVEPRALADTMTSSLRGRRPSSWRPSATVPAGLWDAQRELMVVNETLRWLHQHWDLTDARNANPQGSDAKARARMVAWRAVRPCLEPYFKEEQDVIANLVRTVDALAKRVDALSADYARLLGAVRSDLVDAAAHFEDAIAGIAAGAEGHGARGESLDVDDAGAAAGVGGGETGPAAPGDAGAAGVETDTAAADPEATGPGASGAARARPAGNAGGRRGGAGARRASPRGSHEADRA